MGFIADVRFAVRLLRRSPGWSAVVILTLALGIGANSAIFSLAYAALLRPLPFAQPDRLVWVSTENAALGLVNQTALSPGQIEEWRPELEQLFSGYAFVSEGGADEVWRLQGQAATPFARRASGNLFSFLGVRPQLGRLLRPDDALPGHGAVVVLSDEFWRRKLGADPAIVSKAIEERFSAYGTYTVVGVLPPQFHLEKATDIWLPAEPNPQRAPYRAFYLIGRRRDRVTVATAQAALRSLEARQPAAGRDTILWAGPQRWTVEATPLRRVLSGDWLHPLLLLLAATGCLLLACANVAHLLLGRWRQRQGEIAVRLALGCPPGRLARQLLTESGVLAVLGGGVGLAAAAAGLRLLQAWGLYLLPAAALREVAGLHAQGLDPAVVGFSFAITAAAVLGFGAGPAFWAARPGRANGRRGAGRWLVTGEVAVAMTLVVAAGVLIHSFAHLAGVDPGFQANRRIGIPIEMPIPPCATLGCREAMNQSAVAYIDRLLDRLRGLPGIEAAAAAGDLPLGDEAPPTPAPPPTNLTQVFPNFVTPEYFAVMGMRLVAGRDFNRTDAIGRPKSLIVSEGFARSFFAGHDPLGRKIQASRCETGLGNPDSAGCTVIGVVADVRDQSLALAARPEIYESIEQDPIPGAGLVLRTVGRPAAVLPEVEAVLRSLPAWEGKRPYVFAPTAMEDAVAGSIATPRFRSWMASLLAGLALLLAAVGIYGVQSYAVARRVHEIGVRMALGADRGSIFRLIVGEALGWTLLGVGAGLALGVAGTRLLASLLFEVPTWDPVTLALGPLPLLAVALIAAYVPARRATRVDPLAALRVE